MTNDELGKSSSKRSLFRNALALHANTVIGSALGYASVVFAARLFDKDDLGRDMAMISAMMLLAAIAEINLGVALARFLPQMGRRSSATVAKAYVVTSAVAIVLALAFVAVAPTISDSFDFISITSLFAIVFIASVVIWNLFALNDSVLTAVRRAIWIPIENTIFGVAKIVLLIVWGTSNTEHGIFYAWIVPMALLAIPMTFALFRWPLRTQSSTDSSMQPPLLRDVRKYLGFDYLASVVAQAGTSLLPLVVVVTLGTDANAGFAVAFAMATALEQLSLNVGLALTVEGAFDEQGFADLLRHSFIRFGGLLFLAVVIGVIAAPLILWPLGDKYDSAIPLLQLLLLGLIPQGVEIFWESLQRMKRNGGLILLATLGQAVLTLVLAVILSGPLGLNGVGWAWLIAHSVVGLAVAPSLIGSMRTKPAAINR